MLDLIAYK